MPVCAIVLEDPFDQREASTLVGMMRKPPHEVGMMDQPPLRMEKERSVQSRRTRSVRRLQSSLRGPREGHGCDYAFDENAYRGSTARAHERVATWAHTTTIANNAVYRSIGCYRAGQLSNAQHQVLERDTRSGAREPSDRNATSTRQPSRRPRIRREISYCCSRIPRASLTCLGSDRSLFSRTTTTTRSRRQLQ